MNMLNKFDSFTPYVLITSNLIPLIGVLWFDWKLEYVMILYWLECLIIGFYSLIKMLALVLFDGSIRQLPVNTLHILLFCWQYSVLCYACGWILLSLLDIEITKTVELGPYGVLSIPQTLFDLLTEVIKEFGNDGLVLSIGVLTVSHGFSLFEYFFQSKNIEKKTLFFELSTLKIVAFSYMLILQTAIDISSLLILTFGSYFTKMFGSPIYLLAIFVILKIVTEFKFHLHQQAKFKRRKQ